MHVCEFNFRHFEDRKRIGVTRSELMFIHQLHMTFISRAIRKEPLLHKRIIVLQMIKF